MTIPATRSAGSVLGEHTTLVLRCIDRLYLNLYQPRLQYEGGVVGFFRERGFPIASSALMAPISAGFVAAVHRFVRQRRVPLVDFKARERKDDVMARFLAGHDGSEGILFVGRAQEKCRVFRTEKRVNSATGKSYPWMVRATAVVNHFYFYGFDDDFGPFFIKFCSYFPYGGRVYVNGHHYAQRQAAKAGIGFEALDNGFASCADPDALQRICDGLSAARVDAFVRKWLAVLPHPFTAGDRAAGFRYDLSVLQAEFSVTAVVDRPRWGRAFFDQVIAENLTIGRPDQISIIFDRLVRARGDRPTPSRFRTRVITAGVTPSIHVDYKHSRIKQYFKENRAVRTELTVNDTADFGIRKRLPNLPDLAAVGFAACQRLLEAQTVTLDSAAGVEAFETVCQPQLIDGRRVAGMRFDAPRTHAVLSALLGFGLTPRGFTSADLRHRIAGALGVDPAAMTVGQIGYDLRRCRDHGLIAKIPHTHRYQVTTQGRARIHAIVHARHQLTNNLARFEASSPANPARALYRLLDHMLDETPRAA
jgi:hypothetical protein